MVSNKNQGENKEYVPSLSEILESSNYSVSTARFILQLIFYGEYTKFSSLNDVSPKSKGSLSNYLNYLKDEGLLEKRVSEDRSVNWLLSEKGKFVMLKEVYLKEDSNKGYKQDLIKKKNNVADYLKKEGLNIEFKPSDLKKIQEEFNWLKTNERADHPMLDFLKTFLDINRDDYELIVKKSRDQ